MAPTESQELAQIQYPSTGLEQAYKEARAEHRGVHNARTPLQAKLTWVAWPMLSDVEAAGRVGLVRIPLRTRTGLNSFDPVT